MTRFYVYEVLDSAGLPIYVGKGSGRRGAVSCRERGGCQWRKVAEFGSERAAYRFEVRHIAKCAGLLNRHPGGNGPRSRRRRTPKFPLVSRADVARFLLSKWRSLNALASKRELTKQEADALGAIDAPRLAVVANG